MMLGTSSPRLKLAPALWLAGGAACGSFAASRWTVRKGNSAVRTVVLLVCGFVLIRVLFQVLNS